MSNNFYLKRHVYKGEADAHINDPEIWHGAFDDVPIYSPFRRCINEDHPFIHVCLTSDRIYWAMVPEHVIAFAHWFSESFVFIDECERNVTGREFLNIVERYGPSKVVLDIGSRFS